eukprot:TRINITY_DN2411_c0_g1_i4.p3 TRINITY_DN2411_c0_g1~~TRINITY_DN2411_c0_g1_i4.p3  ORF type:complete len:121 (+),score=45.20 TRINITY_DN2411_c0_g1_i4:382-744(+)
MYDAWCQDPASVHPSWDAHFRGASSSVVLPALAGAGGVAAGAKADSQVIDAHLAVQGTIRSYQVRGHLAAQIDPLGLNNMEKEKAKNMIIRSVTVEDKDLDTVFQLPKTTFIGGQEKSFL